MGQGLLYKFKADKKSELQSHDVALNRDSAWSFSTDVW